MISKALKTVRRAAAAPPHEWWIRGTQLWYQLKTECRERFGLRHFSSDGHLRSMNLYSSREFRHFWKYRDHEPWVPDTHRDKLRKDARERPLIYSNVVDRATAIVNGAMPFFSRENKGFGHAERWHRDMILDRQSPLDLFTRIPFLDALRVGDSKHVWEPNRWSWVYPLGAAYVLQSETSFYETFTSLATDWFEHNAYPIGINYCSALEVAIRSYAMLWALELFRVPLANAPDLVERILREIWIGCQHIEENLSYYFAPNTHILGEGFCLFVCGVALPDFHEASRWRKLGADILRDEADKQIHDDGTHRELSTCYHLYTTDFYLQAWWHARHGNCDLPEQVELAARRLATRLAELTPANGMLPQLNDCDGGRLTWFASACRDARPGLRFSENNFGLSPHKTARWDDDHGWAHWLPDVVTDDTTASPIESSRPKPDKVDSGLLVHQNQHGDYVAFRAGSFGYLDCPHSHDGPLGLLLALDHQWVIVDCGTGAYTQGLEIRNRYRLAQGKNTILVNRSGPSQPMDAFGWSRKTDVILRYVDQRESQFTAMAEHQGFSEMCGFPVRVMRQVTLFDEGIAAIVDRWVAEQPIQLTIPWTMATDIAADQDVLKTTSGGMLYCYQQGLGDAQPANDQHAGRVTGPYSQGLRLG